MFLFLIIAKLQITQENAVNVFLDSTSYQILLASSFPLSLTAKSSTKMPVKNAHFVQTGSMLIRMESVGLYPRFVLSTIVVKIGASNVKITE